uniref:bacterial Ig-like domain-containing protein n=1 Tax=Gemmiger formicilis TaxID=745368 RepID=UPI0040269451
MNGLVFNMVGGGGGGVKLVSIAITTPPAKTTYVSGETFSPAGMIVTATYSNGATLKATGYSFSPDTALTDGTTSVTIEYTEGGVTKTAEQAITVVHRLTKIEITAQPTKKAYEYGDSFQSAGMVVKATYSDGATANVTGYSCSPTVLSTVGTQTITVSYTENGVTKTATTSVTVNRKTISAAPSQSGTLTYNGGSQSPTWNNYNTAQLTIGGTTTGTNAGSYTATFAPKSNYRWSDGSTTPKSVSWSIGKAAGSLSISPTSMTLDTTTKSKTITVTRSGDGAISASSNNTGAATVSVSGNTVTVTGKANGSATITISVAAGTNYTAPANKTCAVTVSFLKDNFADNDWASIIAECHSGSVPSTWVVGNSKTMTINGTSYQIDIIGKNHDTYASGGKAPLTFQLHDCYGETKQMNSSNTNSGGWTSCAMR